MWLGGGLRLSSRLVGLTLLLFLLIFNAFFMVLDMHQLIEELRSLAYPWEPPDIWVFKAIAIIYVAGTSAIIYMVVRWARTSRDR